MSHCISPSTHRRYGVALACKAGGLSRSSYYSWVLGGGQRKRPGPKPHVSDDQLLEAIRKDLADSPFKGEGHRKVHARLKRLGMKVGRQRVLKLMRDNHLLSPHRLLKHDRLKHEGEITTPAPNQMWATDGTKIFTRKEGWIWAFLVVDHWNGECLGYHLAKKGDRFAALAPLCTAVNKRFGSTSRGSASGVKLKIRSDNGSQYHSSDYRHQLKAWGIEASYGLPRQPETNGVVERFNRTLKEQAVSGEIFEDIEEARLKIGCFIDKYNDSWLLEKLDYQSPLEAWANWRLKHAA